MLVCPSNVVELTCSIRARARDTQAPFSSSAAPTDTSSSSSSSGGAAPRQTQIQDLVKLLYESEDPLWELVRFEAEMSAAQDKEVRLCVFLRP